MTTQFQKLNSITKEFILNEGKQTAPSVYGHLKELEKLLMEFHPTGQKQAAKVNACLFHLRQALTLWRNEKKVETAPQANEVNPQ